ncbi:uncharacterized protein LOC128668099 [Microplitis demolitor]|uniref:uncharacterized protein LOC128668099 n=1 Tax=Microplitis demolitor TaxID=69319 RepID=UPI00235B66FD|nr:uncharacterized protein LOC128668099 [Microplitis demolitor]
MTAEQIKALKTKRGNAKRSLTTYENFLKKFDPSKDFPILEKRYKEIETVRKLFEEYQLELEALLEESEELTAYRTEFENLYYETYAIATNLLSEQRKRDTSLVSSPTTSSPSATSSSSLSVSQGVVSSIAAQLVSTVPIPSVTISPSNQSAVLSTPTPVNNNFTAPHAFNHPMSMLPALPTITLPTFSGSFDTWLGFYDLFNSLVNEDHNIPPIRKLIYLKGCLTGEAANVISCLETSSQNYEVAWGLLKERYDDRRFIRDSYIKSLLDTPPISKESSIRSFLDHIQRHLRVLNQLGEPTDYWDSLLIVLFVSKFNNFMRERWEEFSCGVSKPTMKQMLTFLTKRAQLEGSRAQAPAPPPNNSRQAPSNGRAQSRSQQSFAASTSQNRCLYCQGGDHYIYSCKGFAALSPFARYEAAKGSNLCTNCLRKGHHSSQCPSGKCQACGYRHHTLLHFDKSKPEMPPLNASATAFDMPKSTINMHAQVSSEALLATAIVDLVNKQGKIRQCRVFLDAGSQAHFITEKAAKFLNLDKKAVNISVTGVDNTSTSVKHSARATLKSRHSKFQKIVEFLIVPQISQSMPSIAINVTQLEIPKNISLADPEFYKPSEVDALIGVKLFYKLLSVGQISLKNHPDAVLHKTLLGWIVAGEINSNLSVSNVSCHLNLNSPSSDISLTRFWEVEEIPSVAILSSEEKACEEHYKLHTTRTVEGRYVVRLPFNSKKSRLGDSYSSALKRFFALERRFQRDHAIKHDYLEFLREYKELGHMSVSDDLCEDHLGFYLPHHAVLKDDSITTKIRVVFDGSAKTSTGISLNDTLMVGPQLQDSLFTILTRWRSHPYVLTADVEKMYRQILVHPEDAIYQKILYRETSQEPIKTCLLSTVTYGTACASHLSVRTLHQLAYDEGPAYPLAVIALLRDFYVDDLFTGAKTLAEAECIRDELINLLKRGKFRLRKWASNEPALIQNLPQASEGTHMSLDPDATIKTLGIRWSPRDDTLFYTISAPASEATTKRAILSQIAKLFDPLGLLGPIIVYAKIIMQLLWKAGLAWDESIPISIHSLWAQFRAQLSMIEELRFKRSVAFSGAVDVQLHGFCDASERAYGACIYIRSIDEAGHVRTHLVCSKSRVAPVSSLSLPRLELCAALLLSRLYDVAIKTLLLDIKDVYLWSDSTITLHWINTPPHLLKTFVANRVAEIQRLSHRCHWRHVSSQDNPADSISRGQTPAEFVANSIWQTGPSWLQCEPSTWPKGALPSIDIPEMKPIIPDRVLCMKIECGLNDLLEKYHSSHKLKRVVAYVMRFVYNARHKNHRRFDRLSLQELQQAHDLIIRITQHSAFLKEIKQLKNNEVISDNSKLIPLNPYLDEQDLLRVGGRLARSSLTKEQQHPLLLPARHYITRLIITEEHVRLKHAGTQATLYSVRQTYWPLDGRNITRKIIYRCITCFRAKPRAADHVMGILPEPRVTPSRPFLRVGVDYCGPLYIKEKRFRNRSRLKVYVAIYVCMSTKAVHLELVSDLTTEAFIGSLRRLFSRRGKSLEIYSDNATNFVGANRELNELQTLFNSEEHKNSVLSFLTSERITWHFIPPRAPHFGGLWEAAVKSFKHHLIRTVGDTLLTFEQLETCVIEIEAILNSRPISPMSSDPNDLLSLTAGHFLVGGPLTSFPQDDLTDTPSNRLSAWQHAQQLKQHFWKRWHKEYLHQLITLSGHLDKSNGLQVGSLVLIVEENLPPLQWALGRITAVHPGADGIIRVVTVKTSTGEYTRCTKRVCPLPLD